MHRSTLPQSFLSSLYYRRQPRARRADRSRDQEIITACGEQPACGYRRVVWWLGRTQGLVVNGKRVLRVMRERGLLVRQRRFRVSRRLIASVSANSFASFPWATNSRADE
jgi:hypothetical protein